jgi:DNA-binding MarR family transcriptional regulator
MTRPLTPGQVAVLGALRNSDQHELEAWELAPLVRLPIGAVKAAVRDLTARGLVCRRCVGRRRLFSWAHERRAA